MNLLLALISLAPLCSVLLHMRGDYMCYSNWVARDFSLACHCTVQTFTM